MNRPVSFKNLSHAVMQDSANAILGAADIVLHLWPDGEIAEACFASDLMSEADADALKGHHVAELMHPDDRQTLEHLIDAARRGERCEPVRIRHARLLQRGTYGRYSAYLKGDGKNITMIGCTRSVAGTVTGQAVDAEIDNCRHLERAEREATYRAIFEQAPEGLIVVNLSTGLIEQSNLNAADLLDTSQEILLGSPFLRYFNDGGVEDLLRNPTSLIESAATLELTVRSARTNAALSIRTQMLRGLDQTMLIIRLKPVDMETQHAKDSDHGLAVELLKRSDVPVLLADQAGRLFWSNRALTSFVGCNVSPGCPVSDILGVPEDAMRLVFEHANKGARFLTSLSVLGSDAASAQDHFMTVVSIPSDDAAAYGILLHIVCVDVEPELDRGVQDVDALAQMIGKAPLKALVRKSTDVIERNCIEAALRLTGNNRAAAANVLGLSRQSLYIKLHQHDLL